MLTKKQQKTDSEKLKIPFHVIWSREIIQSCLKELLNGREDVRQVPANLHD